MSQTKSPIKQALDLALFGPLGLALSAKDAMPDWVDKGRGRLLHHVEIAKMVGEHATRHGQRVVSETLVSLGVLPGPPPPPPRPPVRPESASPSTNGSVVATAPPSGMNGQPVPGTAELAIPGYDSLSASQVVQRLAGLAPPELEAVRTYEGAGRGRRTILTRISQLQSGRT